MTSIVHVITGLTAGGAEEMLLKLVAAQHGVACRARVVSLTSVGPVGREIEAAGVPVTALGMRPGRPDPRALLALIQDLRRDRPALVQTWMYHADLLGGLAAAALGVPVIWGVRHDASSKDKVLTRATRLACAALSRWLPAAVVFNSEAARSSHAREGYARDRLVVIPNGFDLERFRPDPSARAAVRAELGIPADAPVVGLVARYHPDKDHAAFLAAAAQVHRARPEVRFLLAGENVDAGNGPLAQLVAAGGLEGAVRLAGVRTDVERIFAAMDVACLSSRTESFPNVLGEAMACGVPCVTTDCGDARAIVGETGAVVPPGDAGALARALEDALALDPAARRAASSAARARIAEHYGLDAVVRRFAELQERAIGAPGWRAA